MSTGGESVIHSVSEGGMAADHPVQYMPPILVGPSTDREFNMIKAGIIPFACWRVDDLRFEFDSSFVKPEVTEELPVLARLKHTKGGLKPTETIPSGT